MSRNYWRVMPVGFVVVVAAVASPAAEPRAVAPAPRAMVPAVAEVPRELRDKAKLDPFYEKHVDLDGLPVLASAKVSDEGVQEAAYLIKKMLTKRPDVLHEMARRGVRFVVMAPTEMTTDVPEQRHLKNDTKTDWDKRARGLGGRITSCGEENLLNLRGDRYRNENILVHEFSHAIHRYGAGSLDRKFDARLQEVYRGAMAKELWKDTYAASNHSEYWAEGVQSYYDCNAPPGRGVHNDVNTREKLAKYDPALFELIDETFGHNEWRYTRYDKRNPPQPKKVPYTYTVWMLYPHTEIITGTVERAAFERLFKSDYLIAGVRAAPPEGSVFDGLLVVRDGQDAVGLPIVHWVAEDNSTIHLCQGTSKPGKAPAFSALAESREALLRQIKDRLAVKE